MFPSASIVHENPVAQFYSDAVKPNRFGKMLL